MSWVNVGAAAITAAGSIYASNQASNAQQDAAKKNNALQQQMFNAQLNMYEPQRALGYGALSDLSTLYGYALPQYTPVNQLMLGGQGSGYNLQKFSSAGPNGMIRVDGRAGQGNSPLNNFGNLSPYGGSQRRKFGGYIDPISGTVSIPGQEERSALLTQYLRTGEGVSKDKNPKLGRFIAEIDSLRAQGWTYDPNRAAQQQQMQAQPQAGPTGQPGNMSRFFTSPDYQFRRDEGTRGIANSFAARGGAASGNALRALSEFNSGLASGEYGNYVNRLFRMAGMGESSTNNAANATQNATNSIMQNNQMSADARASGVMGMANGISGAINSGVNGYLWNRYLNNRVDPMSGFEDIRVTTPRIPGY